MARIHNNKSLKDIRKSLRNNSTSAEATLWKMLKQSQVGGYKFRRQHSVSKFILDFYCPELQLGIELDGEPHANPVIHQRDLERDEYLLENGITILRYENRWVFEYPDVIIEEILEFGKNKK